MKIFVLGFKSIKLKFFILLVFSMPLFPTNITYSNLTETTFKKNESSLTIKAQKKVENIKKDVRTLFFNHKKYVSDNFYYEKGSVSHENYDVNFQRMFRYAQNLYLTKAQGSFFNTTFRAKSMVIYKDKIVFKHIFFESKYKRGSRLKFTYYFAKKNKM